MLASNISDSNLLVINCIGFIIHCVIPLNPILFLFYFIIIISSSQFHANNYLPLFPQLLYKDSWHILIFAILTRVY